MRAWIGKNDEWYPMATVYLPGDSIYDELYANAEVDDETAERWRRIRREFDEMQAELQGWKVEE